MKSSITLIALLVISLYGAAQWTTLNPYPTSNWLQDIQLVSPTTAYCAGYGGYLYKTSDGGLTWDFTQVGYQQGINDVEFINPDTGFWDCGDRIMKTTDGAQTWITTEFNNGLEVWAIDFFDADTGYAVGESGWVLKTEDGGTTWDSIPTGIPDYRYNDVACPAPGLVFIAGNDGEVIRSNDGGASWTLVLSNAGASLNSLFFLDADTGYAAGHWGVIVKTTDGGDTWDTIVSNTNTYFFSIHFISPSTGFVAGWFGNLWRTDDYGQTWSQVGGNSAPYYQGMDFISPSVGMMAGDYGTILKTTDSGLSWDTLSSGIVTDLYSVFFTSADTGYAAGESGLLLKTTNAGTSWDTLNSGTTGRFYDTYFTSPATGYVSGVGGTILKTTDSGLNWTPLNTNITTEIRSILFIDEDTGFAAGNYLIKTTDGGATWNNLTYPVAYSAGLYYSSSDVLYSFYNNTIHFSTDYGHTWTGMNPLPGSFIISDLVFLDTNTGYASMSDQLFKTTDHGLSWTLDTSLYGSINRIVFIDSDTGFIATNDMIYKTTDAGMSWFPEACGTAITFHDICFADPYVGYFVGQGGTILRYSYTLGAGTGESVLSRALFTCYPNPAGDMLNLCLSPDLPKDLDIRIYNMNGQLTRHLYNDGRNRIEIDVSAFGNGIFLVVAKGDGFFQAGKVVVQH